MSGQNSPGSGQRSTQSTGALGTTAGVQFGSFNQENLQNETIVFGNPFYLNPNENMSISLVFELFDGSNYSMWSRSMQMVLKTKHKVGFIDGTITMPPRDSDRFALWDACNTLVLCWIQNSVAKDIRRSVLTHSNAKALWDELKRRYGVPNALRIMNLEDEIGDCKQGTQTISQYYTKVKGLWDEYVEFNPIIPCACAPGNPIPCAAVAAFIQKQETDYLIKFLRGLNPAYDIVKTQLLMQKPLPSVSTAVDDLLQHEQKLKGDNVSGGKKSQTMVLAVEGEQGRDGNEGRQGRKFCRFCKMRNHNIEDCWKLKKKQGEQKDGTSSGSNSSSGTPRFVGSVNQSGTSDAHSEGSSTAEGSGTQVSLGFTAEEMNKLRYLLQAGAGSPSPPNSPSINHQAFSVSQFLSPFPNHSGKYILSSFQHTKVAPIDLWILDTGASDHIACSKTLFCESKLVADTFVYLPNSTKVLVSHIGTVKLPSGLFLYDVLLVPSFNFNLISVSKLTKDFPLSLHFQSDHCEIQDLLSMKRIGLAKESRGLYQLTFTSNQTKTFSSNQTKTLQPSHKHQAAFTYNFQPQELDLWHWRLGHPSHDRQSLLHQNNPVVTSHRIQHCETCHYSKHKKLPFPVSTSFVSDVFQLIHVDIWGPLSTVSYDNYSYFLTIVDDCSRAVWVYLMRHKSEARSLLQGFCNLVKNQFNTTVKIVRSDGGKEFEMNEFYKMEGIEHQVSCVETPEQNGRVERKHQHILNVARSLRFQSGIPMEFWSDCILHAVYIINRMPTPILKNKSPYEILYKQPPHLGNLKVFGSLCYASTLLQGRTKFASRAKQCIFLGLPPGAKGYKLLDIHDFTVFVSRNVTFYEDIFPFRTSTGNADADFPPSSPSVTPVYPPTHSSPPISMPYVPPDHPQSVSSKDDGGHPTALSPELGDTSNETNDSSHSSFHHQHYEYFESEDYELMPQQEVDLDADAEIAAQEMTKRKGKLPARYNDYYLDEQVGNFKKSNSCYRYPVCFNMDHLDSSDRIYAMNVMNMFEPVSYYEAIKIDEWNRAINNEIYSLEENQTWDIVPLPKGKKPIGNKWVFKLKLKQDGSLEREKARLVAKGFTQVYGIDFLDTYSPVAKINSVKALLAIASVKNWILEQLDVSNAFLHGDLEEEVYMKIPLGVKVPESNGQTMVCKLKKSLYGLKQASRQWFAKLTGYLMKLGFAQSASDYSLFTKWVPGKVVVLLVYVDDIIIGGDAQKDINQVKMALSKEFKLKMLGPLKYFLGLEITRNEAGISVCQRKYCTDLLKDTGYLEAKGCKTPMDCKVKLTAKGTLLEDGEGYRRLVGRLHYLTITRPDIAFPVQQLCQYQKNPCQEHMQAAYRVLRYLKTSPGQGIHFSSTAELKLIGYSDSDWASCPDTRRSVTGYCTFLGSSLLTWKTKKQTTVSRSSSEAEYRALAHLVCEVQWLRRLLAELTVQVPLPISIYCDNRSAIHIAENPVFHERTKHIEIDMHVTRERIKSGLIKLEHVGTTSQLADLFTKGLDRFRIVELLSKLGIKNEMESPT
ncbi:unnamed protein product [Linum trigynum]|uniref:Integrase catalytic domain-containing protein n=1 Tax=Linum trigynum TaxID=586398 RepID=A0AAV2G871_9ROSI